jgi:ubiquinone/menaquinone biosynthesis C-methylase UbiE
MTQSGELPLDNDMLVRWEFASEERLEKRNAILRRLIEGIDAEGTTYDAVAEAKPETVLEVGPGAGALSERIKRELGAKVTAIDISERMVTLTAERGIEAVVGDVQALPFEDESFDVVVAAWVLYHVGDRDRAIAECARVLRPGGRFVAATLADDNMADLWEFLGHPRERSLSFSAANGEEQLRRHFPTVEVREVVARVVFPNPSEMRSYVAANMTRAHLVEAVPDFAEPVSVRTHDAVFVAVKA